MTAYGDAQKYFLQAMMQKGSATDHECDSLIDECFKVTEKDRNQWTLSSFITSVNKQIQPFHLEIRKGNDEDSGQDVYALISVTDHDINHLVIGGNFTKIEIEIFHRAVDLIVSSNTGMVSSTDILNITEELPQKNILKSEIEILITKLVKQNWVGEKDGMVYLTPRSILELEPYIKAELKNEVLYCNICKSMVLKGVNCKRCRSRIHLYCASTYFRGRSMDECKCPVCHDVMTLLPSLPNMDTSRVNGSMEGLTPTMNERRKRRR
uniref:non-structural maintenance of chromosomes element 1 homolog n=1 Tax=Styela clava TaxID=7725 RepID=UPI001939A6C4|nr:non-structural maintenance of chromosomes element 1 homolog [Styela clava]